MPLIPPSQSPDRYPPPPCGCETDGLVLVGGSLVVSLYWAVSPRRYCHAAVRLAAGAEPLACVVGWPRSSPKHDAQSTTITARDGGGSAGSMCAWT